jgi:hypothetical protein
VGGGRVTSICAIQTTYAGHRFRSRLEARWCVFFRSSGVHFDYEPQGYVVNGKPYLPDFYLRGFGFFEVKGDEPESRQLYQELATQANEFVYVACGGIPDPESFWGTIFGYGPDPVPVEDGRERAHMFLQCSHCGRVVLTSDMYCAARGYCYAHDRCERARMFPPTTALSAARSARFEHGEVAA